MPHRLGDEEKASMAGAESIRNRRQDEVDEPANTGSLYFS